MSGVVQSNTNSVYDLPVKAINVDIWGLVKVFKRPVVLDAGLI